MSTIDMCTLELMQPRVLAMHSCELDFLTQRVLSCVHTEGKIHRFSLP